MTHTLQNDDGTIEEAEAVRLMSRSGVAMVLTNPRIEDNPIVYANDAFERMTGYNRGVVVGRNCRFLQSDETDPQAVETLRAAIEADEEATVDLLNMRADGTTFINRLIVSPVLAQDGTTAYFLGIQKMLRPDDGRSRPGAGGGDRAMEELQHRVKNHLSMIVGLIRVQARESTAETDFAALSRRVESLQILYEELTDTAGNREATVDLGAYLTRMSSAIAHLDGRAGIRVNIDAPAFTAPVDSATRVGLIVSEVLTNALQHAFYGRETGLCELRVTALSDGSLRCSVLDDGIGMPEDVDWPSPDSMGGRIVLGLVDGLGGSLDVVRMANGTGITLDIPAAAFEG